MATQEAIRGSGLTFHIYYPALGRFLSADPTVKYATSTQGLNRHSYTDNNPLSRVDLNGFSWLSKTWKKFRQGVKKYGRTIASMAIMAFAPASWGVLAKGFVSGVVSSGSRKGGFIGIVTAGVFQGVGDLQLEGIGAILAHGAVGGVSSVLSGGKFRSGFLSAGFAKWSGRFTNKMDKAWDLIGASVAGGIGSEIGGGRFQDGAITGAF